MKASEFFKRVRDDAIVAAIAAAEQRTSGELRVVITQDKPTDAVATAQQVFEKLGMTRTRERNGVLLYIAPGAQQFAVLGDTGIYERCGGEFWKRLAAEMEQCFRQGKFTEGIVAAVHLAGERLAEHFPRRPDDRNELPDQVVRE